MVDLINTYMFNTRTFKTVQITDIDLISSLEQWNIFGRIVLDRIFFQSTVESQDKTYSDIRNEIKKYERYQSDLIYEYFQVLNSEDDLIDFIHKLYFITNHEYDQIRVTFEIIEEFSDNEDILYEQIIEQLTIDNINKRPQNYPCVMFFNYDDVYFSDANILKEAVSGNDITSYC